MKGPVIALVVIVLLLVAVAVAPLLQSDPGYVVLRFQDWTVETSVLVLLAALFILYFLVRAIVWLWRSPTRAAEKIQNRRAERQLERGLLALSEGDWKAAEKALVSAASLRGPSTAPYVAAARAAQERDAGDRRDEYLALADDRGERKSFLVALTRARLLVEDGQYAEAVGVLERLRRKRSHHPQVLSMLARCYRAQDDWNAFGRLLPALRDSKTLAPEQVAAYQRQVAVHRLNAAPDGTTLKADFKALSKAERRHPEVAAAHARRALALGDHDAAEASLADALKHHWDGELVRLYAESDEAGLKARLGQVERWLAQRPEDADLHYAMGRLCVERSLWGKASDHLRASLRLQPTVQASEALGDLYRRHGEMEAALTAYQNALRIERGEALEPIPATRLGQPEADLAPKTPPKTPSGLPPIS